MRRFERRGWRACAAAVLVTWAAGCSAGHPRRALPANAVQPPGASFEGEPSVGPAQTVRVAHDILVDSARRAVQAPAASAIHVGGRLAERVAVRLVELAPGAATGIEVVDRTGPVGGPSRPARLTLLPDSRSALDGLLATIAGAATRVDLMMYGWEDDPTGRLVAEALAARARAGVRVRVLVDKAAHVIHNPAAARREPTFLDALSRTPNVTLVFAPDPFVRFDHRKLAVVDGRVAWSGSMILTDVALRRWRNYSFLAEGPVVADYADAFARRWRDVGQPVEPPMPAPPLPGPPGACARLVQTDFGGERSLKESIYRAVDHATGHIYLSNPYFSDEILVAKLVAAAKRGVDVRAVLTLRGNVGRLNRFSALNANRLLRGGVRVYLYPAMTHVKAMSVDGRWAYLGTGNFDELSLRNNREAGLAIEGPGAVRRIDETLFLPDMAASEELHDLLPPPRGRLALEAFSLWY